MSGVAGAGGLKTGSHPIPLRIDNDGVLLVHCDIPVAVYYMIMCNMVLGVFQGIFGLGGRRCRC
jgi:hypothetical protein